jgi:hypothetical protein
MEGRSNGQRTTPIPKALFRREVWARLDCPWPSASAVQDLEHDKSVLGQLNVAQLLTLLALGRVFFS